MFLFVLCLPPPPFFPQHMRRAESRELSRASTPDDETSQFLDKVAESVASEFSPLPTVTTPKQRHTSSGINVDAMCTPLRTVSPSQVPISSGITISTTTGTGESGIGIVGTVTDNCGETPSRFPWKTKSIEAKSDPKPSRSSKLATESTLRDNAAVPLPKAGSLQDNLSKAPSLLQSPGSTCTDPFEIPVYPDGLLCPLPAPSRAGVTVLSEFTTASFVMNSQVSLNPWAVDQNAILLDNAIRMPNQDRLSRQWRDYQYILKHPCALWSRAVLDDLWEDEVSSTSKTYTELEPSQVITDRRMVYVGEHGELAEVDIDELVSAYKSAKRRVLFLDYGGTLLDLEGVFMRAVVSCVR